MPLTPELLKWEAHLNTLKTMLRSYLVKAIKVLKLTIAKKEKELLQERNRQLEARENWRSMSITMKLNSALPDDIDSDGEFEPEWEDSNHYEGLTKEQLDKELEQYMDRPLDQLEQELEDLQLDYED